MADLAGRIDPPGRRIVVFSIPGDRRDEDIRDAAAACLPHFTHFVCKADIGRRGRGYDELPKLTREYLLELGVEDDNIHVIPEEDKAVEFSLNMAEEGDLLVITAEDLPGTWKQITTFDSDDRPTKETLPGTKVFPPGKAREYELESDEEIIIDDRGARISSTASEGDD